MWPSSRIYQIIGKTSSDPEWQERAIDAIIQYLDEIIPSSASPKAEIKWPEKRPLSNSGRFNVDRITNIKNNEWNACLEACKELNAVKDEATQCGDEERGQAHKDNKASKEWDPFAHDNGCECGQCPDIPADESKCEHELKYIFKDGKCLTCGSKAELARGIGWYCTDKNCPTYDIFKSKPSDTSDEVEKLAKFLMNQSMPGLDYHDSDYLNLAKSIKRHIENKGGK